MDGALLRASLSSVAIQRELRPKALPRRPRLLASFAFATPGDAVQGSYSLACQRVSNAGTSWRRATFARVCNLLQTSPADFAEKNVREMEMDMSCMLTAEEKLVRARHRPGAHQKRVRPAIRTAGPVSVASLPSSRCDSLWASC